MVTSEQKYSEENTERHMTDYHNAKGQYKSATRENNEKLKETRPNGKDAHSPYFKMSMELFMSVISL